MKGVIIMKNSTYDKLKILCLIILPAFITFLLAVLPVLNIPHKEAIILVLTSLNTMLGTIITQLSRSYNKSQEVDEECSQN